MKLLEKQKEWKKGKETHKASRRRGQIRFNSAASASAISSACQRVWATLETLHCQPASLPACQPACLWRPLSQCSVLSARTRCLLPVNTHTSRFSLRATHTSAALDEAARYKCKRWRGKEGGYAAEERTLWSAMQVKMYYGRRWTKAKWSKVNFITSLRVP